MYIHERSVVLKVCSVKCFLFTNFTFVLQEKLVHGFSCYHSMIFLVALRTHSMDIFYDFKYKDMDFIVVLNPQMNPCYGYLESQENPCYWYLEQQENPCSSFSCIFVVVVIFEYFTDQALKPQYMSISTG